MQEIDFEALKYQLDHIAHGFDSQTFIVNIEEHYGGELYKINFQRGYSTYTLEVDGERLARWQSSEEQSQDMKDMIDAVKLAVEELES